MMLLGKFSSHFILTPCSLPPPPFTPRLLSPSLKLTKFLQENWQIKWPWPNQMAKSKIKSNGQIKWPSNGHAIRMFVCLFVCLLTCHKKEGSFRAMYNWLICLPSLVLICGTYVLKPNVYPTFLCRSSV